MGKIIYKSGDIFQVTEKNSMLTHACNCKGVWGSGIAVEFKKRFPWAFQDYEQQCKRFGKKLLGMGFYSHRPTRETQPVGLLFTSYRYGDTKDPEDTILFNTSRALKCLLAMTASPTEIHSPKINAGRFAVPWEKTEKVLEDCLTNHNPNNVKWTVWEFSTP